MPLRFAINGLGRIGRALVRVARTRPELELVAINDLASAATLEALLARDSIYGRFAGQVASAPGALFLDGRAIPVFDALEPARIPWEEVAPQLVVEATGKFARRELAAGHLRGAVERVVISSLAAGADWTACLGVNQVEFSPARHRIVSNASCTTNCLAVVASVIEQRFGIRRALMNTVHCYTSGQHLLDSPHEDPRRARAAGVNLIPTTTGAVTGIGLVMPALAGKVAGYAVRVPTAAVSLIELVADLEREADEATLRAAFCAAASAELAGVLAVTEEALVSSDLVGDPHSAVVDLPLIQVVDRQLARVVAWYDNEWGYANRLADLLVLIAETAPVAAPAS